MTDEDKAFVNTLICYKFPKRDQGKTKKMLDQVLEQRQQINSAANLAGESAYDSDGTFMKLAENHHTHNQPKLTQAQENVIALIGAASSEKPEL